MMIRVRTDGQAFPGRATARCGASCATLYRISGAAIAALLCFAAVLATWWSGSHTPRLRSPAVGPGPIAAARSSEGDGARIITMPPPLIVFLYDFGGGGVGDFLKGMVSSMQLAVLAGCDFRVDFSRHPFGSALPLMPGIAANAQARAFAADGVRVFNTVDWLTSPTRRGALDALLAELASGTLGADGTVTCVQANLAMSRELAVAVGAGTDKLIELAERSMASIYERVIDGATLGTFWPAESEPAFRIAVHLREGDRYIAHATGNKNDTRVGDQAALARALAGIYAVVMAEAPTDMPKIAFACGDTVQARELLHTALAPHATVISSPEVPVHIGYSSILDVFGPTDALRAARDTVREHQTLASADLLFILSGSGFSQTACSTAAAGGRFVTSSPRCFVRGGSNGDAWDPFDAVRSNFLSPNL
jgi:hypothetical protein